MGDREVSVVSAAPGGGKARVVAAAPGAKDTRLLERKHPKGR
jgi:hypothetical protein